MEGFFASEPNEVSTQIVDVEKISTLTQCVSDLNDKVKNREVCTTGIAHMIG